MLDLRLKPCFTLSIETRWTPLKPMIRRYLYGWWCFARAVYLARTKKRGAGKQKWRYALETGHAYRWIVDGQMRGKAFTQLFKTESVRAQARHTER